MIKNQTILEIKKDERVYQLSLANDSPLGEIFDVLSQMRHFVYEKIRQAQEAEKPKEDAPKE